MTPETARLAAPVVKSVAEPVLKIIAQRIGAAIDNVRIQFNSSFRDHMEATKRRCSYVRTILSPDFPTPITDIYIPLHLKLGESRIQDIELLDAVCEHQAVLITGTAGAGKSMIMRYLALSALDSPNARIPLFIDLRDIGDPASIPVATSIFSLVTPEEMRGNRALFDECLRQGVFLFLLDGLDEIPPDSRPEAKRQLEQMLRDFPKCQIIISARPEIDFTGWDRFVHYSVSKLTRAECYELIQKVPFDTELKERFVSALDSGLYNSHETFLEVPLLAVIVLMTFSEYLDIPEHSTAFYDQAFEVLYRRHDRSKGPFKRKHFSNLPADKFRKVLSVFCYRTLAKHKVSFSEEELAYELGRAADIAEVSADATALSQDIVESVSLMQRDGAKIYFIHRTLQEYFAAYFVVRYRGEDTFQIYNTLVGDLLATRVAPMVAELDMAGLEREWVYPKLKEVIATLDKVKEYSDCRDVLTLCLRRFEIRGSENGRPRLASWGYSSEQPLAETLYSLASIYPDSRIAPPEVVSRALRLNGDGSICDLASEVDLPEGLRAECNTDQRLGPEFFMRVDLDEASSSWVNCPPVREQVDAFILGLRRLYSEVEARVTKRSQVSVLQ